MIAHPGIEGEKMRRVLGIVFADSPSGRVARVAGTGLAAWEIIKSYRAVDRNFDQLREGCHARRVGEA